ncbi:MAG: 4-hydroxy-tetrahydrodipicolinate reductase [Synergistaceae bacterium]|nr:4-hydroxy-tetrahydrodipicolinate reductase [Synergistaceae bacterium]
MNYGIIGYSGRMGREIMSLFDISGHTPVLLADEHGIQANSEHPQVILNFALPASVDDTVDLCVKHSSSLVIGTTGLKDDHIEKLKKLSGNFPVIQSFNFATGINVLKILLREFSAMLSDWDSEIVETHHNKKKDAPSGTAILLRDSIFAGDAKRKGCEIHSLRIGGVPGDHVVEFSNDGEVLTFSHRAISRTVFALGALKAAEFALDAKPGFYSYEDVLKQLIKI